MAVTITQQPRRTDGVATTRLIPNAAYTNLLYVLSSSNATQPQFRYVTTISEGGTDLTTIKTYPNETNRGVIDVAPILQSYLGYDQYWELSGSAQPVLSMKDFDFDFGEEYGTSISSSTTIYTGSATTDLQVIPARVFKNENSYDWDIGRFNASGSIGIGSNVITNDPAFFSDLAIPDDPYGILLNSTDYQTATYLADGLGNPSDGQRFQAGKIENGTWSVVANFEVLFCQDIACYVDRPWCQTAGIGPMNLRDLVEINNTQTITFGEYVDNGSINAYYSFSDVGGFEVIMNDKWDGTLPSTLGDTVFSQLRNLKKCPSNEYTRFAWINPYGFWDYYNVYTPLKKSTEVNRYTYHKPFVRYNETLSSYNISNRGLTQYNTDYQEIFSIQTNYEDRAITNWLSEMFESPEVYIQETKNNNTFFTPVNILNQSKRWQLTDNREKVFQYNIQFKYANELQSR